METKEYAAALLLERLMYDACLDRQPLVTNPLQWSIMRHLRSLGGKPVDAFALAQYLGRAKAPTDQAVATLEECGLVTKRKPGGSNLDEVILTDAGLRALESDPMLRFSRTISALDEPHRNAFLIAVRAIAMSRTS